jgi:nitrogen fixation protein NifX
MATNGRVRVALTTNSLTEVDADFMSARQMLIYDIGLDGIDFIDAVQFTGQPEGMRGPGGGRGCSGWDPLGGSDPGAQEQKVRALIECGILVTLRLSDFAAVRIYQAGTFPIRLDRKRNVMDVVDSLHRMAAANPPRWLRKKLGMSDLDRPWSVCAGTSSEASL